MSSYYYEFLTYHTGDRYEKAAKRLKESAKQFDIDLTILKIKDQGSWHDNVNRKAEVYYQWYMKHKKPFVILDADCVIHQEPVLFKQSTCCDIAHLWCKPNVFYISTGICAFDSNKKVEALLKYWVRECSNARKKPPNITYLKSDLNLKRAWNSLSRVNNMTRATLPKIYGKPYWVSFDIQNPKDIVISCNERCTLYEDGYENPNRKRKGNSLDVKSI